MNYLLHCLQLPGNSTGVTWAREYKRSTQIMKWQRKSSCPGSTAPSLYIPVVHIRGKKPIKFKDKHGGRLTLLLLTCIFQHTAGCCYSCTWFGDTRIPYHRLDGCTEDATSLFHQGQQVRVARVHRAVVRPGVSENFARHSYAVERMLWHHQLET